MKYNVIMIIYLSLAVYIMILEYNTVYVYKIVDFFLESYFF
jgi:hypothetical protein